MLCVSRDLFNEQAGAGGRLHERKLPMGDGEERKTPTRILEEEEEVRKRHSSALSPPSLSCLPSVSQFANSYHLCVPLFLLQVHMAVRVLPLLHALLCVMATMPPLDP